MFIFGRACGCFLYAPSIFRTDRDVREIEQQRVCPANSTLNSVHGSTLFNRLFSKGLRKGCTVNAATAINARRIRTAKEGSGFKQ